MTSSCITHMPHFPRLSLSVKRRSRTSPGRQFYRWDHGILCELTKKKEPSFSPSTQHWGGKRCHFDDIFVTVGTGSCENVCYSRLHFFSSHVFVDSFCNRPILQIPQCICSISYNAPFRTEMCTFLFWMVHCGIWNWCAVGFVN